MSKSKQTDSTKNKGGTKDNFGKVDTTKGNTPRMQNPPPTPKKPASVKK